MYERILHKPLGFYPIFIKGKISKRVLQENKTLQTFWKTMLVNLHSNLIYLFFYQSTVKVAKYTSE